MPADCILETERLLLRQFTEDDAEAFYKLGSDPVVLRYTGDGGFTSIEEARAILRSHPLADYQKYGFGRWACILKGEATCIGFAGLKYLDDLQEVDLGYRFLPAYWGCGLATEAARASRTWGFDRLGLEKIIGLVLPLNVASVRVLEKSGLTFERMQDYRGQRVARYVIESSRSV